MAKPKLLIVEDDEGLCSQYRWAFPACDVLLAHSRPQAVALVKKERPPIAIMDLGLPPDPDGVSEGFATLDEVQNIAPETKVIIVTGNGERKNALKAVAAGAYDFCEKPVEIEVLRTIIERGLNLHRLEAENRRLAAMPARSPIDRIVTANAGMLKVCRDVLPPPMSRFCCWARAAPAKRHWRRRCTSSGPGPSSPSLPSIAGRSRKTCWNPSCSAMNAAPSPAR
jgi:two-component system NtrC family response regulator